MARARIRSLGTPISGKTLGVKKPFSELWERSGVISLWPPNLSKVVPIFAIPPTIYRGAFWGTSAFGVLFGDSQKVPQRVLPIFPGTLGSTVWNTSWESPKSTLKALAGALSGIPPKALL